MSRVSVIGAGLLGRGIATVIAAHGHDVTLYDSAADTLAAAAAHVRAAAFAPTTVRSSPSLEQAVVGAELVIEAVIEDLALKQQLFLRLGTAAPRAILMSNSSSLPIGRIAVRTPCPERAVGTHWWNPPDLIPIVEVIRGPHTDADVIDQTTQFLRNVGKQPVYVARDVPGFVGNRLQHALWREAIGQLSRGEAEGLLIDHVIASTLGASLAERGPIADMRRLGTQTVSDCFAECLPQLINAPAPAERLRTLVAAGQLGAKSGRGFLAWSPGRREEVAARLAKHVQARLSNAPSRAANPPTFGAPGASPPTLTHAESALARRLQVALWREALSLLGSGVASAEVIDEVACRTFGLRLAVLGPIENADYVGLDLTLAIHSVLLPSLTVDTDLPAALTALACSGTTAAVSATTPAARGPHP